MSGSGTMLAVGLSREALHTFINKFEDKISIAAVNGPESVTISGTTKELKILAEQFEEKKIFNKFLRVDVPYHSPILECLKKDFIKSVVHIKPQKSHMKLFSTVTGKEILGEELGPEYWWRNLRDPVYFLDAIEKILEYDVDFFCEIWITISGVE